MSANKGFTFRLGLPVFGSAGDVCRIRRENYHLPVVVASRLRDESGRNDRRREDQHLLACGRMRVMRLRAAESKKPRRFHVEALNLCRLSDCHRLTNPVTQGLRAVKHTVLQARLPQDGLVAGADLRLATFDFIHQPVAARTLAHQPTHSPKSLLTACQLFLYRSARIRDVLLRTFKPRKSASISRLFDAYPSSGDLAYASIGQLYVIWTG